MSTALMRRIEREALKAARQNKKAFKLAQANAKKKLPMHCQKCGQKSDDLRCYADESNIAITYSSPALCPECRAEE